MKKEKQQKMFYCTINTECTYGKIVMNALEALRDRLGLPVSRIIQDALISYEMQTRNKECSMPCLSTDIVIQESLQARNIPEETERTENTAELLGLFASSDVTDFHI